MVVQIVLSVIDLLILFLCIRRSKGSIRISLGYIIPTVIILFFNRAMIFRTGISMNVNNRIFLYVTGAILGYTALYLLINTKKINSRTSIMFLIMVVLLLTTSKVTTKIINIDFIGYDLYMYNVRMFISMYVYLLLSIGLMCMILLNGARRTKRLRKSRI